MFKTFKYAFPIALAALAGPAAATIVGGAITSGSALTAGGEFIKLTVPFTESDPDSTVGDARSRPPTSTVSMRFRTSS